MKTCGFHKYKHGLLTTNEHWLHCVCHSNSHHHWGPKTTGTLWLRLSETGVDEAERDYVPDCYFQTFHPWEEGSSRNSRQPRSPFCLQMLLNFWPATSPALKGFSPTHPSLPWDEPHVAGSRLMEVLNSSQKGSHQSSCRLRRHVQVSLLPLFILAHQHGCLAKPDEEHTAWTKFIPSFIPNAFSYTIIFSSLL